MPKKRPVIDLAQPARPHQGDLEQLFGAGDDPEQAAGLQILAIRLDAIEPDPNQPRRTMVEDTLQELCESIRQDGVIQPVEVVEVEPRRYRLVHGERRWRAAEMAGLDTIPAVVRRQDYDSLTRFVRQLVENIQREDLNDLDRATALLHLRELMQQQLDAGPYIERPAGRPYSKTISWAAVGERLGYTRQRIHQLARLLDLPEPIQTAVRDGRLSERDTRVYHGLRKQQQLQLHRAQLRGEISSALLPQVAQRLKKEPGQSVSKAIGDARLAAGAAQKAPSEPVFDALFAGEAEDEVEAQARHQGNLRRIRLARQWLFRLELSGPGSLQRREVQAALQRLQQEIAVILDTLRAATPESD